MLLILFISDYMFDNKLIYMGLSVKFSEHNFKHTICSLHYNLQDIVYLRLLKHI
jgi:hypothetical protein